MADKTATQAAQILESIVAEASHLEPADLLELGHAALDIVLLRTKKGLNVDGQPFKSYTDPYRKQREKTGYGPTPDLVRKGHMLGAALVRQSGADEVTVEIVDRLQSVKAASHNYGSRRGMPKREFMDIRQDAEVRALAEMTSDRIVLRVEKKLAR